MRSRTHPTYDGNQGNNPRHLPQVREGPTARKGGLTCRSVSIYVGHRVDHREVGYYRTKVEAAFESCKTDDF